MSSERKNTYNLGNDTRDKGLGEDVSAKRLNGKGDSEVRYLRIVEIRMAIDVFVLSEVKWDQDTYKSLDLLRGV